KGLQKNINPSITEQEAVDMLSQHIITKPVFEALFENYSFVKHNPISKSMQTMLDLLDEQAIEKDTETLQKFYDSVKMRAAGIDNAEGKQRIIIELYDKFFKTAFPKMVERLGIVYTPVEVVDYIIHSVNDVLKKEFERSISDENIHVLDPFTGTGTFITRLIQSGLIESKDLKRKYERELHANEIVLLAYYIAAVNIENAFHDAVKETEYSSFDGICLTDTFQLGETEDGEKLFSEMFPQNSERVVKQKKAPLRVIMGNPPYSVGQKSANDIAQNQDYPNLDEKIANTYAAESSAGLNKSLYDAYIKAFRWSTDRLDKNGGIICFVSNGAWLDGNSTDGFRKCIEREFNAIYVFNLRGNQRTSGELSRKEGGKIFGSGSRTPIAITLLVKKPIASKNKAVIHYHDIGDYLTREEKLSIVKKFHSVDSSLMQWKKLKPNDHGDWISQRNDIFQTFIPLDPEKKFDPKSQTFFTINGPGISSGRDFWVYNFSKNVVEKNVIQTVNFYNKQEKDFLLERQKNKKLTPDDFIDTGLKNISWTVNLKNDLEKGVRHKYETGKLFQANYRPFTKQFLYYDKSLIERPGMNRIFFPTDHLENIVISISGVGSSKDFTVLVSDKLTSYDLLEKTQCFPLH
ncbi:MAG: type ISP restriction/modification enzyme, partial [Bacteroidota bacterium]